jgi:sec-independent protein translocase protein TatA
MGLENPIHLALLLMIMLLVFGAKRLPEMGRSLGDGLRGFKEAVGGHTQINHLDAGHASQPTTVIHTTDNEATTQPAFVAPAQPAVVVPAQPTVDDADVTVHEHAPVA